MKTGRKADLILIDDPVIPVPMEPRFELMVLQYQEVIYREIFYKYGYDVRPKCLESVKARREVLGALMHQILLPTVQIVTAIQEASHDRMWIEPRLRYYKGGQNDPPGS